mmetsp:Transcript_46702/g.116379  ORF Transcript_46702/g.116379 Transcript_46702/m.116379 type:complete len:95 (+) Transcript_46702:99-383(+)
MGDEGSGRYPPSIMWDHKRWPTHHVQPRRATTATRTQLTTYDKTPFSISVCLAVVPYAWAAVCSGDVRLPVGHRPLGNSQATDEGMMDRKEDTP